MVTFALAIAAASLSAADGQGVFVSLERAQTLMTAGATVLDGRGKRAEAPYLPGARAIEWSSFTAGWFRSGKLDDDLDDLGEELQALGVTNLRPVLIYGDVTAGWGEEARIWWMLRYLGHDRVYILDGGIAAWRAAGRPTTAAEASGKAVGRFEPRAVPSLRATVVDLRAAASHKTLLLDVRTREEFEGATPFGASRGGHIPGAKHLHWEELVDSHQRLLPARARRERLAALGGEPGTRIIVYCTGGVRAAFVQAALLDAGFESVANYDASWWEWAARDDLPVAR